MNSSFYFHTAGQFIHLPCDWVFLIIWYGRKYRDCSLSIALFCFFFFGREDHTQSETFISPSSSPVFQTPKRAYFVSFVYTIHVWKECLSCCWKKELSLCKKDVLVSNGWYYDFFPRIILFDSCRRSAARLVAPSILSIIDEIIINHLW